MFLVLAKDLAQRVADFAHASIGPDGFEDEGHQVFVGLCGSFESGKSRLNTGRVPVCLNFAQLLDLVLFNNPADPQQTFGGRFVDFELVDADDDSFVRFNIFLIVIGRVLDGGLNKALLITDCP